MLSDVPLHLMHSHYHNHGCMTQKKKEDGQFIKQAQKDPQAYEWLYKKYAVKLYAYFWHRVSHQKEIAEDLVQETFVKALEHLSSFKDRGYSYFTYLSKIGHNLLVNYYKSKKPISLEHTPEISVDSMKEIEQSIDSKGVWSAVQKLTKNSREAIILRYQNGLSIREIAHVMKKTENAVKLLLSRARKRLLRTLSAADFGKLQRQHFVA